MQVLSFRVRLAAAHLAVSAVVVSAVALTVLAIWYPPPLAALQGLQSILVLLALVDLGLGPLCTLVIASPRKSKGHIARDVAVIGFIQLAALAYGVQTVWVARPAFIVFNKDRFDVVTASELELEYFGNSPQGEFASPPLGRAIWVHALPPKALEERNRILFSAATGGPDLKNFPALYHRWPQDVEAVRHRLKPLQQLTALSQQHTTEISKAVERAGLDVNQLAYVPLVGRGRIGVVLLKRDDLSIVSSLDIAPNY